jgi:ATPase subunit of ABC transporter with duplicated ATPase domains
VAHLLGAERLRLEYPTRVVFDGVTVGVSEGDRIGVVGRNGDGKSTLLSLLSGRLEPDDGRVTTRRGVTVGMLDQGDVLDPALTVSAAIVGERAEHEWAGDARIRDVIAGLVSDIAWDAQLSTLSGGQQRRVALAALLVGEWDVVMLDEPTNHLDVEGIAWLAEHLRARWSASAGGLVVVTHDRWFLDAVSTATWEVHDGIVEAFEGGYAAYILQRVERDRMAAASESRRQNLMRKELAWLRRGAPARTSKPKFRIDAATELIADEPPPRNSVALSSLATARLGKDVVDLEGAGVEYDGRPVLTDITWRIAPGERTGILGANGAGKSTLLSLVAGTLQPTSGRVKRGKTVNVATLSQRLEELEGLGHERVRDVVGRLRTAYQVGDKELSPGQLLERLGFSSAQLSTAIGELSGGQRRRLQLLLVLLSGPNVLILDEPTNDMDTDMLAAIEDLLDEWPGTLLVVSHDRYLVERVTDQQYAVMNGTMRHLPGGVDEYVRLRTLEDAGRTGTLHDSSFAASSVAAAAAPTASGLSGAERRTAEKELSATERRIAKLEAEKAALHLRLAESDQSDYAAVGGLHSRVQEIDDEIDTLEFRWLDLQEQLG